MLVSNTPPLLETGSATARSTLHEHSHRPIKTLGAAHALNASVCIQAGDTSLHYADNIQKIYPGLNFSYQCETHEECINLLHNHKTCELYIGDDLRLRYAAVEDANLAIKEETLYKHIIAWAIHSRLDPAIQFKLMRWIYYAKEIGFLDRLYNEYFNAEFCPLGKAGPPWLYAQLV